MFEGGDTRFTNQRAAYRALPLETQREIEGIRAVHVYESKYSPRKMPTRMTEEEVISRGASQPAVLSPPHTTCNGAATCLGGLFLTSGFYPFFHPLRYY
jgi:alpha-ketoglutarate-dependent taurine dioxygenase